MHTWRGFLHLHLGTDDVVQVQMWWLLGVLAALGLLLWGWRGLWRASSPRFDLQWALLVGVALFTAPHANFHDLSLLLVPGALVARYLLARRPATRREQLLVVLPLLGYVVPWITPLETPQVRLQLSVLFTLLMLVALAARLRQRERRTVVEAA
jgi:hypothetical protein